MSLNIWNMEMATINCSVTIISRVTQVLTVLSSLGGTSMRTPAASSPT